MPDGLVDRIAWGSDVVLAFGDQMVTISRYTLPEEAHVVRCFLEGHGVEAWVFDEYAVQWYWLISNAVGGVRLVVREEDRDTALELLKETLWAGEAFEIPRGGVPVFLLSILFGIPFLLFGRRVVRDDAEGSEDVAA